MNSTCRLVLWLGFVVASAAALADDPAPVQLTRDGHFKQRPCWSPDGRWLVFARHEGNEMRLHVRAADGSNERRLLRQAVPQSDPAWSPKGDRIAYTYDKVSPGQGDMDLHVVGAEGGETREVAGTRGLLSHEEWPSWSPDAERLAFTSTRHGNSEVCIVKADGSDERRLTSDPALDLHPSWSPDGKRIAFSTDRWGDLEIALLVIEGQEVVRLTESRGLDDYPAWSPDGKRLAFVSNRAGNQEIFVMDVAPRQAKAGRPVDREGPSEPRNVSRHRAIDTFPCWRGDGGLTWVSNRGGAFEIYLLPAPDAASRKQ